MYVCICNAIREEELRQVARCHAGDAETAYGHLGCEPLCGQCLCDAEAILRTERETEAA